MTKHADSGWSGSFGTRHAFLFQRLLYARLETAPLQLSPSQSAGPWGRVMFAQADALNPATWAADLDRVLAPRRIELRQVSGASEAIRTLLDELVDLAVLASLAGCDGLHLLEVIRSIRRDVPCVLLTTDTSAGTLRRAMALDAHSVVHAPANVLAFTDLLVRLLQKQVSATGRRFT